MIWYTIGFVKRLKLVQKSHASVKASDSVHIRGFERRIRTGCDQSSCFQTETKNASPILMVAGCWFFFMIKIILWDFGFFIHCWNVGMCVCRHSLSMPKSDRGTRMIRLRNSYLKIGAETEKAMDVSSEIIAVTWSGIYVFSAFRSRTARDSPDTDPVTSSCNRRISVAPFRWSFAGGQSCCYLPPCCERYSNGLKHIHEAERVLSIPSTFHTTPILPVGHTDHRHVSKVGEHWGSWALT